MMLQAALTGGIATGKSYCLARFAALGVPMIDADAWRARPSRRARRDSRRSSSGSAPACCAPTARSTGRARRASSSPTAPRAPTSRPSSTRTSTAGSASGSPTCRRRRRVGDRRHPAAVRDRPRARLRRGDRLRLRAGRAAAPADGPRSALSETTRARGSPRSGRSKRRSARADYVIRPTARSPRPTRDRAGRRCVSQAESRLTA